MWNPVPDLDVGLDVTWYHMNTAFGGATGVLPALTQTSKPAGPYTLSNLDTFAATFRIQRNFLY